MASYNPESQGQNPPVLPPKPSSHETSRIATPSSTAAQPESNRPVAVAVAPPVIPDSGEQWLPQMLQDKSTSPPSSHRPPSSMPSPMRPPPSTHPFSRRTTPSPQR
ncbi:hypothetical protein G7046_g9523 [Stylonectria norvegica]|nr:hypothetical protein G7046_g9523 [Stylonectria norvegica]